MDRLLIALREIPNIHPVVVKLPLGLLPAAVGFDVLGLLSRSRDLFVAGRWTLWAGTLGAAAAAATGLWGAEAVHPYVSDAAEAVMTQHMNLQLAAAILALGLSTWRFLAGAPFPRRGRAAYVLLAMAMLGTLAVGADHGGRMVYLHGVGVRAGADSLQGGREGRPAHHHGHLFSTGGASDQHADERHHGAHGRP